MAATTASESEKMETDTTTEISVTDEVISTDLILDRDPQGHLAGLNAALRAAGIDTVGLARTIGEDSVSGRSFSISSTDEDGNDLGTTTIEGDLVVGAAYERAQTTAIPLTLLIYVTFGLLGTFRDRMAEAALAAIEAGMAGGDPVAVLAERGFDLSEATSESAAQVLNDMRATSTRTVQARVTFDLDEV